MTGVSDLRVLNSYEAAKSGRRLKVWAPGNLGPNRALLHDLNALRERSRDATRNNAWIRKGINSWVSNEIGTGIEPSSLAPDKDFRKQADALWRTWSAVADADGMLDVYGLIALSARERIEAGESFIRKRLRDPSFDLPVPLQLQLLEPEFCPHSEDRMLQNGRVIRAGIEFDGVGRRRAYWMYKSHPGDAFLGINLTELVPVPAPSMIHHFAPLRAGQIRGVPWTIQALIKSRDFDEYEDAELIRKKSRASYTGVIQRKAGSEDEYKLDPNTGGELERDENDVPMTDIESGTFVNLLTGEEVKLFDGDTTGAGYAEFVRQQLLGIAAGLDEPYEFLSGDMSKVNDRLMRVIRDEFHRIVEQTQWHFTIPQVCNPIWVWFVDAAVLSGALIAQDYATRRAEYLKVEWHPQRWPYLHPLQDVQASLMEISGGLTSRKRVAAERGMVVEDIDEENAEDQKRAKDLGLRYKDSAGADMGPDPEPDPADPTQADAQ